MKEKSELIPVPKPIWIATTIIIVILFLLSSVIFAIRDKNHRIANNIVNIADKLVLDSSVYIFGTSIARGALPLKGKIISNDQLFTYKVLTKNGGEPYEFLPLVKQAAEKGNCTIFIETNMLCNDIYGNRKNYKIQEGFLTKIRKYAKYHQCRSALSAEKHLNLVKTYLISFLNKESLIEPGQNTTSEIDWQSYRIQALKFRVRTLEEILDWLPIIKNGSTNNVEFYLLDVPRSQQAKSYLLKDYIVKFDSLVKSLEKDWELNNITFPNELDQSECFVDAGHMKKAGKKIYTSWFETVLDSILTSSNLGIEDK